MKRIYRLTHYARFPRVDALERGLGMNTKTMEALRQGDELTYEADFNEYNVVVSTKSGSLVVVPKSYLAELV